MKKGKLKGKIIIVGLLVFTIYVVVSCFTVLSSIRDKKYETASLQQQIQEKEEMNKELQEVLDNGIDQDYVIKRAREKLGLVFPDERVYVDISGK